MQLIPNTIAKHAIIYSNTTVALPLSAGKIMIVLSFFRFLNAFDSDGVTLDGGVEPLFLELILCRFELALSEKLSLSLDHPQLMLLFFLMECV